MALSPKHAGTGVNLQRLASVIEAFDQSIALDPCDSNMHGVTKHFHQSVSTYLTRAEIDYIVDLYKSVGWTYVNVTMSEGDGFPKPSIATLELQLHG